MRYHTSNLIFSNDKKIDIVGTEEEINKLLKYIKQQFNAVKTMCWFECHKDKQ
jgi:hypothetical protein